MFKTIIYIIAIALGIVVFTWVANRALNISDGQHCYAYNNCDQLNKYDEPSN